MGDAGESNLQRPPRADAGALDRVVDDLEARRQCADWVRAELLDGRAPEQIVQELAAAGWPPDDAESIVEEGRRQTRTERGIVTRDDVVRQADAKYRRGMTGWMIGFPVLGAAQRLLYGLANLVTFRRLRDRRRS